MHMDVTRAKPSSTNGERILMPGYYGDGQRRPSMLLHPRMYLCCAVCGADENHCLLQYMYTIHFANGFAVCDSGVVCSCNTCRAWSTLGLNSDFK